MSYVVVNNFKAGLDRRGSRLAGDPGSLWDAKNVVINRKGEIERRKKFVGKYTLPAGTYGLHAAGDTLYVFGSSDDPGVPAGVTYQKLTNGPVMESVLATENFDGKPYVIANFNDVAQGDVIYHFYDGNDVVDWHAGVNLIGMTTTANTANLLKELIDASDNYSATRSGSVVSVSNDNNISFADTVATEDVGGTDDQTITSELTQQAVEDIEETLATGTVQVTAGTAATAAEGSVELTGGSSGAINDLSIDGESIIVGNVPFNGTLAQTASDLADKINENTTDPNYTAEAVAELVTITAEVSEGATPNGYTVSSSVTTITTTDTDMASGADSGMSALTVDSVDVLRGQVNFVSSFSIFAAAISAQINSQTSSPDYTAAAVGDTVTISADTGTGYGPNGFVVAETMDAGNTVDTTNFSGGIDGVTGQPQITEFTIGGTFEIGDKFNITLEDSEGNTESFGYVGNPTQKGTTALTFKSKMYSTVSSLAFFSGVNAATVWNSDNGTVPGANYINLASQDAGSQTLYGLSSYEGNLAFFARRSIQIWSVDADESANTFLQVLKNTGSRSPKSILAFGNNDVFYLADSGIRSLRARDSSGTAYVNDVGTAIDPFIKEEVDALTSDEIQAATAVLEPNTDRYFLALGDKIHVFNYFPGSKISAWTYFDLTDDVGGAITDWARIGDTLYARSGNTIYTYGGDDGDTYPDDDEAAAQVTLPYLDADKPGTMKGINGFGCAITNEWLVELLIDPQDTSDYITVGRFNKTTMGTPGGSAEHRTTHFAPRLTCSRAGAATITKLIVHYNDPEEQA